MKFNSIFLVLFLVRYLNASDDSSQFLLSDQLSFKYREIPVYIAYLSHEKRHVSEKTKELVYDYVSRIRSIPVSIQAIMVLVPENPDIPLTYHNCAIDFSRDGQKLEFVK